jgi:hypothetical protein
MVRAQRVGLGLRQIEFVLVKSSRILEGMGCVEKRMFVADIGLQMAVGVGEPSERMISDDQINMAWLRE